MVEMENANKTLMKELEERVENKVEKIIEAKILEVSLIVANVVTNKVTNAMSKMFKRHGISTEIHSVEDTSVVTQASSLTPTEKDSAKSNVHKKSDIDSLPKLDSTKQMLSALSEIEQA